MIRNSICGRQFVQAFLSLTVSLIFAEQSKATIVAPCVVDDLSAQAVTPLVDFVSQIQPIFELNCSGCHIGGVSAGLNLAANVSYGNLVNAAVYTLGVGGFRVAPFDTANSFMFNKVNCTNLDSIPGQPFGLRMPHSGPRRSEARRSCFCQQFRVARIHYSTALLLKFRSSRRVILGAESCLHSTLVSPL
jgi:hypothetical protein